MRTCPRATSSTARAGNGGNGNEIWWNGGANSGKVGGWGFYGSYLTATSTLLPSEATAATYGIFSSNWSGGTWDRLYASNFNDSGSISAPAGKSVTKRSNHGWAEYNALGYSGSNSGGRLVVKHSQFDQNEDGFDTNSQNGDNPPPQNGACPKGVSSPIHMAGRCWVFMHNYVHDNNNPNVPSAGSAAAGPVGTGMSVSGARNDTDHGQPLRAQRRLGSDLRALSRFGAALHRRQAHRQNLCFMTSRATRS